MRWYPLDLRCGLLDLLGAYPDKPLLLRENLNRRLASPAKPYILLQRLLLEDYSETSQILGYLLLGLIYREAFVWPRDLCEPAAPVYGLAEREVVLHPPSYILLISKGADHDESCAKICVHNRV